jgi:hypothetical protein
MLQQSSEPGPLHQQSQATGADSPHANTLIAAPLEQFLDQQYDRQVDETTDEVQQSVRAAKRQEIDGIIKAHMELGSTEEEAAALTLEQLQRAAQLQVARPQNLRTVIDSAFAIKRSRRLALMSFGAASACVFPTLVATGQLINFDFGQWMLVLLNIMLPIIAGLMVGLRAPTQPTRSALRAMAILAAPNLLQFLVWAKMQTFNQHFYAGLFFAVMYLVPATITGTVATLFGKGLRRLGQASSALAAGGKVKS